MGILTLGNVGEGKDEGSGEGSRNAGKILGGKLYLVKSQNEAVFSGFWLFLVDLGSIFWIWDIFCSFGMYFVALGCIFWVWVVFRGFRMYFPYLGSIFWIYFVDWRFILWIGDMFSGFGILHIEVFSLPVFNGLD